jgi:hypothetical protein
MPTISALDPARHPTFQHHNNTNAVILLWARSGVVYSPLDGSVSLVFTVPNSLESAIPDLPGRWRCGRLMPALPGTVCPSNIASQHRGLRFSENWKASGKRLD